MSSGVQTCKCGVVFSVSTKKEMEEKHCRLNVRGTIYRADIAVVNEAVATSVLRSAPRRLVTPRLFFENCGHRVYLGRYRLLQIGKL